MNKNTLLAFVLILGIVAFFTSPTYERFYHKITNTPYPPDEAKQKTAEEKKETGSDVKAPERDTAKRSASIQERRESIVPADTAVTLEVAGAGDTLWVETEAIIAGISEIGGRLVSVRMKNYRKEYINDGAPKADSMGYVDLIPENSEGGAGISINNENSGNKPFSLENDSFAKRISVKKSEKRTVSLVFRDAQGNLLRKQFLFEGQGYRIGFTVSGPSINNNRLAVQWPSGIIESEISKVGMYQQEYRTAHYFLESENTVEHVRMNKPALEETSGSYRWLGVSSKYFFIAMVADSSRDADIKIIGFEQAKSDTINGKKNKNKQINYSLSYQITLQENDAHFWFYTGPSKLEQLKEPGLKFEKILFPVLDWWGKIFFWSDRWFPPVAEFVLWLLLALFKITKDYGVAILLLTVISRVVTFPLTQSSLKSMSRMKDLQPKITALRQKYKSNPKKMNEEMMALYKSEGVNPLNPGCLPMFLQMPIFIALFVVLQKAIELRGAGTVLVPWIHDLSRPEVVFSFNSILPGGIPLYGSNFAILPIIMAGLTYFQNKMTIKDPNQKMMIYFMPIFMLVIFNSFASGLVLYWTLSNALGLIQQYYLEKSTKKATIAEKSIPVRAKRSRK